MTQHQLVQELVTLSHWLGREDLGLTILGEGNASVRQRDDSFWIKASGARMAQLTAADCTRIDLDQSLKLVDDDSLSPVEEAAEVPPHDPAHRRPSVETFLHAVCYSETAAQWVGHTHPTSVLGLLTTAEGTEAFQRHIYPDAIVVCGRHVAIVPYVSPGIALARAARTEIRRFVGSHGVPPKVVLMRNHGMVALGQSATEVRNITLMTDKWARVLTAARMFGGPTYLTEAEADSIDIRPDEAYRRGQLTKKSE